MNTNTKIEPCIKSASVKQTDVQTFNKSKIFIYLQTMTGEVLKDGKQESE
jgi:hypothetical protein